MISETILPRPQAQFIDGAGRPTRQFYDFLRSLIQLIQSVNGDASAIADLLARVEALEAGGGSDAIIQGLMSVAVNGTLAGGVVQVLLQGDVQTPGNTYYYGTDATGVRGWFPVADALDVTPDLTITVGSDGVITFGLADVPDTGVGTLRGITRDSRGRVTGTTDATITGTAGEIEVANGDASAGPPTLSLADVPDTGGGTLQKTVFDSKGRKTGTSAATTDDLPEGATNLYFTDERAQAAIFATAFITSSTGAPLVTSAGDFITSSGA